MDTPSLLHHFEAPEHYLGSFGWLCGYSADPHFLDQAAERFTRQTTSQRAWQGQIALGLMLDPDHPPISLTAAPAVAHLRMKRPQEKPFVLLHAKVAILGFRHETDPQRWLVRLIVSTGNWTVQTVEESLDLAACIECHSEDLNQAPAWLEQNCADISAAWDMLNWLGTYFDLGILSATRVHAVSLTAQARQWLEDWIGSLSSHRTTNSVPRFFDSRKQALLAQLVPLVMQHAKGGKRNYLGMGSGFFEGAGDQVQLPPVLHAITTTLQDNELLTRSPDIDVFVNPLACQAVAQNLKELDRSGYKVRPAACHSGIFGSGQRSLHAKFLFAANFRENSPYCNNAWVYLGSGNLTGPGFVNPMSRAGGNLEAGMLITPEGLVWDSDEKVDPGAVVTNRLPMQWAEMFDSPEQLSIGEPMTEHEASPPPAPVAWLNWQSSGEGNLLSVPEPIKTPLTLLNADGNPCTMVRADVWQWLTAQPRVVTLQWCIADQMHSAVVPVMDEAGRLAATPLPELALDEAWWQLANFPQAALDQDKSGDEVEDSGGGQGAVAGGTEGHAAAYPIRQMMALIENIAAKQVELHPLDWLAWCTRLEQSLLQMANDPVINIFRKMRLNPLSPLSEVAFLPVYAESASSPEGAHFRNVLARIEAAWAVTDLFSIGAKI